MSEERIDSLFDVEAIKKEMSALATSVDGLFKSVKDASAGLKGVNTTDGLKNVASETQKAAKGLTDVKEATTKLTAEEKLLQRAATQLARTQALQSEVGQKLATDLAKERAALKSLSIEQQKAANQSRSVAEYTKYFSQQLDLATMNASEMSVELSKLNRMSFKGLDATQIANVKAEMARLTDAIGDFQARVKVASMDRIPALMGALSGLVGVAQGVTGALSIFGVKSEKLNQAMMGLINVSMALTTIQKLVEERTIAVAAAHIKDMYAKVANTIATKAYTMATTGATASTKLLGKAMMSIPFIAIAAAIAGVVLGIVKMVQANKEAMSIQKLNNELQEKTLENAANELSGLTKMEAKLRNNINNKKELNGVVNEWNEKYAKDYGVSLDATTLNLNILAAALERVRIGILNKAAAVAAEEKLTDLIKENTDEYMKYAEAQSKVSQIRAEQQEYMASGAWAADMKKAQDAMLTGDQFVMPNYEKMISDTYEAAGVSADLANQFDRLVLMSQSLATTTTAATDATDKNTSSVEKNTSSVEKAIGIQSKYYTEVKSSAQLEAETQENLEYKLKHNLISKEEYTDRSIKLLEKEFSQEIETAKNEDAIKATEDALKLKIELEEDAAKKKKEINEKAKADVLAGIDAATEAWGAYYDYLDAKSDAQIQHAETLRDADLSNLENNLNAGIISQNEYNIQKKAIEDNFAAQKLQADIEMAKREKTMATFSVGVNTAKAIMEIWGAYAAAVPLAIAFSALAATTGALQIAAIQSAPLPGYATGRDGGEAEWAITGERGREAVVTNDGIFFTPQTPTLTYLPEGAQVLTAPETLNLLRSGFTQTTTDDVTGAKLDAVVKAIQDKEFLKINITDRGLGMTAIRAANYMHYINRNCKL